MLYLHITVKARQCSTEGGFGKEHGMLDPKNAGKEW